MARSRNIKPGFFQNDELAVNNCALGRIFFIGLWTIADFKGDLEWRPARLKAQLLPYDDCDVLKIAINLDKSGFIRFYSDGESIFLNVCNFTKHQNPHKNERESGSEIPAYSEQMRQLVDLNTVTINRDKSGLNHDKDGINPADSLLLIPDSCNLNPSTVDSGESPVEHEDFLETEFNRFWRNYPNQKAKQPAKKAFLKLLKGKSIGKVKFNVDMILSYHFECIERGDIGADKLHAATLLNQKRWEDNPEFMEQFKQYWLKENASGKPE